MWLYVYSDLSEYSYEVDGTMQRIFLKDISLYYDGISQEKDEFKIVKIQEGGILYKSGNCKHKQLKPSYWSLCFFLFTCLGLSYLILLKL